MGGQRSPNFCLVDGCAFPCTLIQALISMERGRGYLMCAVDNQRGCRILEGDSPATLAELWGSIASFALYYPLALRMAESSSCLILHCVAFTLFTLCAQRHKLFFFALAHRPHLLCMSGHDRKNIRNHGYQNILTCSLFTIINVGIVFED